MTVESDLKELMPHTVTIEPFHHQNAYAEPAWGTSVSYQCRVERKTRRVLGPQGQEVVSSAQVYLSSAPGVSTKDRVTLPDGSKPEILSVENNGDTAADYFEVLYV